jgi:hypothetical protein
MQLMARFGSRSVCAVRFYRQPPPPPLPRVHRTSQTFLTPSSVLLRQVPGNGSAPAQIWADGFHLVLGLANNPALPNVIYAVGKLLLNTSAPGASPPHENVVVEVDINNQNSWSIIASLRNDVSDLPPPQLGIP